MTDDTLNVAAPEAVQSDVLQEQPQAQKPLETKPQAEEPEAKPSREETLRKAIDKTLTEGKDDKPAEKKPALVEEKPKEAEKPQAKPTERQPDGKFAPRQTGEAPEPELVKRETAYREPPQRFDDAAKTEWEGVPESVRGAIHRTVKETEQGIQKYRADAEAYETVRQFDDMARQNGGTLRQTLEQVAELEQVFARNPVEGFHRIAQRLGIDVHQVAQRIASMQPQQVADQQMRMQMADQRQQTLALQQQLQAERQAHAEQARTTQAMTEWQKFQQEHPDAVQLEQAMVEFMLKYPAGDDVPMRDRLADAYAFSLAKTKGAHTATTQPALAQTQAPEAPNPAGQRSISGSSRDEGKSSSKPLSRSEATRKAMRQFGIT